MIHNQTQIRCLREQLDAKREVISVYDKLGMDKDCEQYQEILKEMEEIKKEISELTRTDF